MAFIYKIVNKVNSKIYIGKTENTVQERFLQHIREHNRDRCKNRPLYRAMRKYGIENFEVITLEETNDPNEREIFWISFYNSYSYGYNATKGGDGKSYADVSLILYHLINTTTNCAEVARLTGHDRSTCAKVAKEYGLYTLYKVKGEDTKNSVLTEELVLQIKSLYIPKTFGKRKIARLLNLPVNAVQHVLSGHTWKHINN